MHPRIKYYLDYIKPHYQSPEDLDKVVEMLGKAGATPMQAFITLHEELGLNEDLVDEKIANFKSWVELKSTEALMEVFIYSKYKRRK